MPFVPCPPNARVTVKKQHTVRYKDYENGKLIGTGTQLTSAGGVEKSATKVVSKGKMIIIGSGRWSPTRPYTRTAKVTTYEPGLTAMRYDIRRFLRVWEGYPEPNSIWAPGDNIPIPPLSGGVVGSDLVTAISASMKARLNTTLLVKAGKRQVNFGEALGESRQTISMLAKSVSSLVKALLQARKGHWRAAMRYLGLRGKPKGKTIAEKWLSLQYGWLPLMSDIFDTAKLIKNGFAQSNQLLSCVRNISESAASKPPYGKFTGGHVRLEAKYTAKMWYRLSDSWLQAANQMGLVNPVEVAWALVPFSFVVDWFLPIGSYLEALTSRCGMTFVDGYYGCRTELQVVQDTFKGRIGAYTSESSTTRVIQNSMAYQRTKMSALPWPSVYFKSPFSTIHVANALALLRQLR